MAKLISKDDPEMLRHYINHCREGWSPTSFSGKIQGRQATYNKLLDLKEFRAICLFFVEYRRDLKCGNSNMRSLPSTEELLTAAKNMDTSCSKARMSSTFRSHYEAPAMPKAPRWVFDEMEKVSFQKMHRIRWEFAHRNRKKDDQ